MNATQETWKPVTRFEGIYEVSDQGRVRSLPRADNIGRPRAGKVLRPYKTERGYETFQLYRDGAQTRIPAHRLVLEAFIGAAPEGHETRHLNGDPSDNRLSNLAWGTSSENSQDTLAHGNNWNANKTHCSNGHLFDGTNLYIHPSSGQRTCRTCTRKWVSEHKKRKRATRRKLTES